MKPQPPVTNMRIAAGTSSVAEDAPLVSPTLGSRVDDLLARARELDWTPWLIVGFAALLRFFLLGMKPPHFDEGINGWFVDQMVKNGFYRYDPTNYHGPLHFYVLFVSQTLLGRNIWAIRLPVVLLSIFAVFLTLRFEPFVGRKISRLAALLMAISPGFLFYGRYGIHEVWLLVFSMLFILGLFGLWHRGTVNYLWCAGMGLAGMILTKETYIIHVACAVIAAGVAAISNKITPAPDTRRVRQSWNYLDLLAVIVTGLAVIVLFYSGGFMNWPSVAGLWKTFEAWFKTGTQGAGHEKPWYYWLQMVTRYEQPVLIALLLGALMQFVQNINLRYLAIYGTGTFIAYSIVAYKTPWCIISIVWPLLFVFAALPLLAPDKYQQLVRRGITALLVITFGFSISLNYFRCSTFTEFNWKSERGIVGNIAEFYRWEPYVYVQSYNDVWKLTKPLLRLAKSNPTYYQMIGHLIRTSTYPLPWMLGDFTKVGYYEHNNMPDKLDGDFLLVQEDKIAEVEGKLHETYFTEPMTIRPYQDWSKIYFNAKVFSKLYPGRVPEFTGKPAATPTPVPAPVVPTPTLTPPPAH
jgi:uncharacterized protein (TIGR03663 family)